MATPTNSDHDHHSTASSRNNTPPPKDNGGGSKNNSSTRGRAGKKSAHEVMKERLIKETDPETFLIDNAFLRACMNCGIDPAELKGKPLDSFQSKGVKEDVAVRRFNNFQNARVRKLHLVVNERKKLLNDERAIAAEEVKTRESSNKSPRTAKPPAKGKSSKEAPPRKQHSKQSSSSAPAADDEEKEEEGTGSQVDDEQQSNAEDKGDEEHHERDLMIRRVTRQREFWDTNNARVKKSQENVARQRDGQVAESKKLAEKYRKEREKEEEQKRNVHLINQEQMKKRWERDDELARIRQARIDAEFEQKMEAHQFHMNEVESARQRRQAHLATTARDGSDQQTMLRLERARKLREQEDEKRRQVTQKAVDRVDQRRQEVAFSHFLTQAQLAERALNERKHCQEVIDRGNQQLQARAQRTMDKIDAEEARVEKMLHSENSKKNQQLQSMTQKRNERHQGAKEKRRELADQNESKRRSIEQNREETEKERAERLALERELAAEDAAARQEHREHILKRVAKVAENQQESKMRTFERNQQRVSDRVKKMNEIRSLLNKKEKKEKSGGGDDHVEEEEN